MIFTPIVDQWHNLLYGGYQQQQRDIGKGINKMAIITINPQDTHSENSISYGDNYNITTNMDVVLTMDCLYNGKTNFHMTIMKGHVEWRRKDGEDAYVSGEDEAFLTPLPTVISANKFNEIVYHIKDGDFIEMGGSTWKVSDNKRWNYPTVTKV